ncbi:hypothetical protein [Bernardetia sp.]|uniref:hypothetical protein n=1 Tax=Bernardetia sp. TaxID=1937974 RepID=UPI0025B9E282|nr:hypothetical protein [Bernardetia sp.]
MTHSKTITFFILFFLISFSAFSQDDISETTDKNHKEINTTEPKTIFGKNSTQRSGFFMAWDTKATRLVGEPAILTGGRVGWNINGIMNIGFMGQGLAPTVQKTISTDLIENQKARLLMGYGGITLEPVIGSRLPIHVTFPTTIGAGWVGYVKDWKYERAYTNHEDDLLDDEIFFVLEPSAMVEMNLTKILRVSMGGSYRFTDDVKLLGTEKNDLEGFTFQFSVKLGRF